MPTTRDDIEQAIAGLYERLIGLNPETTNYKVCMSESILNAAGWTEGQRITKYSLPIEISHHIQEVDLGNGEYASDIWVTNE